MSPGASLCEKDIRQILCVTTVWATYRRLPSKPSSSEPNGRATFVCHAWRCPPSPSIQFEQHLLAASLCFVATYGHAGVFRTKQFRDPENAALSTPPAELATISLYFANNSYLNKHLASRPRSPLQCKKPWKNYWCSRHALNF